MRVLRNDRLAALWLCVAIAVASTPTAAQQQKPNILFILADNIGYGDVGAYGGGELRGAPTPRIDQLAAESLRLTQFLVEPGCTPSRAALMTGRYSIRAGLSLVAVAGSPSSLPATEITIAEMLREAGRVGVAILYGFSGAAQKLNAEPILTERVSFDSRNCETTSFGEMPVARLRNPARVAELTSRPAQPRGCGRCDRRRGAECRRRKQRPVFATGTGASRNRSRYPLGNGDPG